MATAVTPLLDQQPADVIRRHVKRMLPVKLDDEELLEIARDAAKKRRNLRQLENDLADEQSKRKQQIKELQREIDTHDRELDTGDQERVVLCDEIFRAGTVYVRRSDTLEEFEPRPATAQEAQRYLPAVESTLNTLPIDRTAPLLDQAAAVQAIEPANDGESSESLVDQDDDDEPDDEDDGLTERTPAQLAAAESKAARKARRQAGAKGKAK